ncbi:MAG: hypothetical protein ABIQ27_07270 [Flavobacterium sp.]|uniref:hypothetical protein n=1 Tax=Flavobacterium sp. TaxID=239 RepID=UPI00326523BE
MNNESFLEKAKISVGVLVLLIIGAILGYSYYKNTHHAFKPKTIAEIVKESCEDADYDRVIEAHIIDEVDFDYYAEAFWYQKPPLKNDLSCTRMVNISVEDMKIIIAGKTCDDFLQFKPTPIKDMGDLKFDIFTTTHKPENSCHAVSLFLGILKNNEDRIDENTMFCFTKGLKIIETSFNKREIRTIVMFSITFTDNNTMYCDIADDPTHRK